MDDTKKLLELIQKEKSRQQNTLMMIPSENYTYPEVREAVGSVLMHKYAEGQPKSRYYQGMSNVDDIELMCEELALKAFGLSEKEWGVNVQPYSGTPANLAVYNTLLEPGDRIMAMYLPDGGHLSHGWVYKGNKITFTSKIYEIHFYHVDQKTKVFDYDEIARQAKKIKPKLLISGGTAYPRDIDHKKMGEIAHSVNGSYLADIAHEAGLISAGYLTSPFLYADAVTMTTHKTLRGPRGGLAFVKQDKLPLLDRSIFPGMQGGPHLHTIAGIAVALDKVKTNEFKNYAGQVIKNAKILAEELMAYGYDVLTGGTDKHLILIDLRNRKTNGWFVAWALEYAGIVANRNTVPNDTGSPFYPSGVRLGTPAITVRGMKEAEMLQIAKWIDEVIKIVGERSLPEDEKRRKEYLASFREELRSHPGILAINENVRKLCKKFPI